MKAILEYPGSKWGIADWIIKHFPEHHSYLEPFFGSGAVLFHKDRSHIETVNDIDGNVVNLFKWIKDDPEKLAHEIYYTPFSRQIYEEAYERTETDSLKRAVQFYVRTGMGYGFRVNDKKSGWRNDIQGRERAYAAEYWKQLPERIIESSERLRGVQIENRPAVDVINRFNHKNVLIYADPPYLIDTRKGKQEQYSCEMSEEDHENLLDTLLSHKGPVIISGYESKLYSTKLGGWHREETIVYAQSKTQRKEVIWMNFEPEIIEGQISFNEFPGFIPEVNNENRD